MPALSISAPGKIILFGEHAVVYGHPAIALPVTDISAKVILSANPHAKPGAIHILAPDIGLDSDLDELDVDHPMRVAIKTLIGHFRISSIPACDIQISSTIPIASGLGSGAAISIALIRAICGHIGIHPKNSEVSEIAFEVEKIYHGTPSGIDNTVISFNKPIFFVRGEKPHFIDIKTPLHFVLADTGIRSKTVDMVNGVRQRLNQNAKEYERIFLEIGKLSKLAFQKLKSGDVPGIGSLMTQNHALLQELNVSTKQLNNLVDTALQNGSLGAKLVGAGGGGHIAALSDQSQLLKLADALCRAGAKHTLLINIQPGVKK